MRVIIINGLMASGKTTIGKILVEQLNKSEQKSAFCDLDDLVEKRNSDFKWPTNEARLKDWLEARKELAEFTNQKLQEGKEVVVVGPFFKHDEIAGYVKYLKEYAEIYLYTLTISLEERLKRNKARRWSNHDEDIRAQEKEFNSLVGSCGIILENKNSPQQAIIQLLDFINKKVGIIDRSMFS